MRIASILLEMNVGKLTKNMHQVAQIEFENCIFSASEGETAPSDIPFFPLQ